jgi:hypothetical protein
MARAVLAALLLAACSSSQPRVCSLSALDMQREKVAALDKVGASDACRAYPVLATCPEAQRVRAEWAALYDQWEACR